MKTILSLLISVAFVSVAFAQDDKESFPIGLPVIGGSYEIKKNDDGTTSWVKSSEPDPNSANPMEREDAAFVARMKMDQQLKSSTSALRLMLGNLDIETINGLSDIELSDDQKKNLTGIVEEYKMNADKYDTRGKRNAYRSRFATKVYEVLLPHQIKALEGFKVPSGGIFEIIRNQRMATYLNVGDDDIRKIEAECKQANDELELLLNEQQRLIEAKRKQLNEIIANRLDKEQQKKLKVIIGKDPLKVLDRSNLENMYDVTRLK